MTTTANIDYARTYFKYPTPTPINGEPTNKALKRLKNDQHDYYRNLKIHYLTKFIIKTFFKMQYSGHSSSFDFYIWI